MKSITIYTDGSCHPNPGLGGWGVLLQYKGYTKELYGAEPNTTNNRMELRAAIEALHCLKEPCEIKLITDSQYVFKGATEWLANWRSNNWHTAAKKPIKNDDLWRQLHTELQRHHTNWEWMRGHSNHPGNDRADYIANLAIEEFLRG